MGDGPDAAVIARLRQLADGLETLDLAALFGSRAAGRIEPQSDIDLAVLLSDRSLRSKREVGVALARAFDRQVDVIHLDEAPPLLRFEIAKSGVLVFERRPGAWARERARAMIDWWDWAPLARRIHGAAVARLRYKVSRW